MESTSTPANAACASCGSPLNTADARICLHCKAPQHGVSRWLFEHAPGFDLLKTLGVAILAPLLVFSATHCHADRVKRNQQIATQYDTVLGSMADVRQALSTLYQPCFNTNNDPCDQQAGRHLQDYQQAMAAFALAVNRYEPDLDASVQLLHSMDGAIVEEYRQAWRQYRACLQQTPREDCDAARRQLPLLHAQAAQFVMEYLTCAIESRYGRERQRNLSTRCWAIVTERQTPCLAEPQAMIQAYADAIEATQSQGMARIPFDQLTDNIIQTYILPGSGLKPAP